MWMASFSTFPLGSVRSEIRSIVVESSKLNADFHPGIINQSSENIPAPLTFKTSQTSNRLLRARQTGKFGAFLLGNLIEEDYSDTENLIQ